ncbi:MAG: PspA/IM30 family protein [Kofleriaceae bacterium]
MGIFSKIKQGISSKANAAIDKAIDPEKEIEMAILELEEGKKKAIAELISYKATAKQMDNDLEKYKTKAAEWEKRAMLAVKAGDDDAAKTALREKKSCEQEWAKIKRDQNEAASYAVQLNKSRKEFETKLQLLKMRKGTLATQLAAARSAGGDAFGNDTSVWDRFQSAEDRIDREVIESEVDSAMRGEDVDAAALDAKILAASRTVEEGGGLSLPAGPDDALAKLKAKMEADKAAKQRALAAGADAKGEGGAKSDKPDSAKTDEKKDA